MKYEKAPLSFEQQADLLCSRGMIGDKALMVNRLREVNYYRLSAYWYPFRQAGSDDLLPDTPFNTVWRRYTFDRQLRLLIMDAIERVEVSVRTRLVNAFALRHGPFGHTNRNNLPKISAADHRDFMDKIHTEEARSKEVFVQHYHDKYASETELPLWMACELMTFGMMLTLYRHVDKHLQVSLADAYGIPSKILDSWLRSLSYVRNLCAHHARLWNRELAIRPFVPREHTNRAWSQPVDVAAAQHRMFSVLTLLRYMMIAIAPQSRWAGRFERLLTEYPDIPIAQMGFPPNWQECPIWTETPVGGRP